jgi:ABC-type lipoprotein export system ATPase subunit
MAQLTAQPSAAAARNDAIILRATGLRKTFRMGEAAVQVLRSADLAVRDGEFVAIEGRSGSGKSTLLHILGALDEPDGGAVFYDNRDISSLDSYAKSRLRNTQFGFVFQFYHLLPELNVLENALLSSMIEYSWFSFRSNRTALRQRGVEVLEQLGMGHRLKHRPSQLSGGERQRVAIARALMNNPKVLFADEPTGNLDAETGRQIMSVLADLHQNHGQTIVMVTHDRTIAHQADRALVLKDGKLEVPKEA